MKLLFIFYLFSFVFADYYFDYDYPIKGYKNIKGFANLFGEDSSIADENEFINAIKFSASSALPNDFYFFNDKAKELGSEEKFEEFLINEYKKNHNFVNFYYNIQCLGITETMDLNYANSYKNDDGKIIIPTIKEFEGCSGTMKIFGDRSYNSKYLHKYNINDSDWLENSSEYVLSKSSIFMVNGNTEQLFTEIRKQSKRMFSELYKMIKVSE